MEFSQVVINIAEIVGIIAFSASGAMTAVSKNLDLFGVTFLGIITALGGGVIRDLLLGITPPSMFVNGWYALLAAITALAVFLIQRKANSYSVYAHTISTAVMTVFDSIGLGVFSIVGTSVAINAGHSDNAFLAISVGVITGTGGGILRDLCSGVVPSILCKHIYAVASIVGATTYFFLLRYLHHATISMFVGIAVVIVLRMLSIIFKWNLPKVTKS